MVDTKDDIINGKAFCTPLFRNSILDSHTPTNAFQTVFIKLNTSDAGAVSSIEAKDCD